MSVEAGKIISLRPAVASLLKLCGLALRDRRRDILALQQFPVLPTSGQIIEVIGTRGVGKTTLNNALHRHLKDRWFFRGDLRFTGPTKIYESPIEALHREIYFTKVEDVKAVQADPWKSLTICRQLSNVICESLLLATHTFPRGFVLDEGLFKTFPAQVLAIESDKAEALWRNRAFVHVRARDPELALERHLSRRSNIRKTGMLQHGDTADNLRMQIVHDDELFEHVLERARAFGRSAFTVYVEDGIQANIRQVLEFEKSLNG